MSNLDQAVETQLANIQIKTGKSLEELTALVQQSGLAKHGEIREMLIKRFELGYGDANTLVHYALKSDGERAAEDKGLDIDGILDEIYSGPKAVFRPLHERFMEAIQVFGPFEIVPKKGYVSLRRKKQFAMIGPPTKTRVEVGINARGFEPSARLVEQPAGSMCNYVVKVAALEEVDAELIDWVRLAYEQAG